MLLALLVLLAPLLSQGSSRQDYRWTALAGQGVPAAARSEQLLQILEECLANPLCSSDLDGVPQLQQWRQGEPRRRLAEEAAGEPVAVRGGGLGSSSTVGAVGTVAAGDEDDGDPATASLRAWAALALFLEAAAGMYLPLLLQRLQSPQWWLSLLNCFSGGIFLAAGLIHLLPHCSEAQDALGPIGSRGGGEPYPLYLVLVVLGYCLVFYVERVLFDVHGEGHSHCQHSNVFSHSSYYKAMSHGRSRAPYRLGGPPDLGRGHSGSQGPCGHGSQIADAGPPLLGGPGGGGPHGCLLIGPPASDGATGGREQPHPHKGDRLHDHDHGHSHSHGTHYGLYADSLAGGSGSAVARGRGGAAADDAPQGSAAARALAAVAVRDDEDAMSCDSEHSPLAVCVCIDSDPAPAPHHRGHTSHEGHGHHSRDRDHEQHHHQQHWQQQQQQQQEQQQQQLQQLYDHRHDAVTQSAHAPFPGRDGPAGGAAATTGLREPLLASAPAEEERAQPAGSSGSDQQQRDPDPCCGHTHEHHEHNDLPHAHARTLAALGATGAGAPTSTAAARQHQHPHDHHRDHHDHDHHHPHSPHHAPHAAGVTHELRPRFRFMHGAVLLVALALHTSLECIALGLIDSRPQFLVLFAAIASHKAVSALALSSRFLKEGANLLQVTYYVGPFCLIAPLSILAGTYIGVAPIARLIFSCFATGTFLYVGASEVIMEEFEGEMRADRRDISTRTARYLKFAAVLAAVALVAASAALPEPHHH